MNCLSFIGSRLFATSTLGKFSRSPSLCRYSSGTSRKGKAHTSKYNDKKQKKTTGIKAIPNAGIRHQLNTLDLADKGAAEEFQEFEDQSELDIFKADQLYDQHVTEEDKRRQKLRQHIVKQKYFSAERSPTILTWAEKEHLRFLHSTDAEVHSPEALAESFNISVETVKKILKSKWLPENSKRIQKHDEAVQRNLKELGLPAPTVALPLQPNTSTTDVAIPGSLNSNSGKWPKSPTETDPEPRRSNYDPMNDTMLEGHIENRKRLSYSEFRKQSGLAQEEKPKQREMQHEERTREKTRLKDLEILKYFQSDGCKSKWTNSDESVTINLDNPRDSDELNAYFYDTKHGYQHPYGRQAPIEQNLDLKKTGKKKNGLHRRGDSFYDADGVFMYRVPELFAKK